MLISSKQLPIGRSQSWDTLGGNEVIGSAATVFYEQQARMAGRRNSLSYGADAGGGDGRSHRLECVLLTWIWNGSKTPTRKSLYKQGYLDRPDPHNIRKSAVPELNSHYNRPTMAPRGSLTPHDYYQQDSGMPPRPTEGFIVESNLILLYSHLHIMEWWLVLGNCGKQSSGGRPWSAAPTPGIPPPPPPTAHDMGRIYREPFLPGPHLLLLAPKWCRMGSAFQAVHHLQLVI